MKSHGVVAVFDRCGTTDSGAFFCNDGSKQRQLYGPFSPVAMVKGPSWLQGGNRELLGPLCSEFEGFDCAVKSGTIYETSDVIGLFGCH